MVAAIDAGRVAPVYLLAGEDGLQQREVLAALRRRVPDLGQQVFDGASCTADEVVTALQTSGLLPGRLAVVEQPRWVRAPRRGEGHRDAVAAEAAGDDGGAAGEAGGASGREDDESALLRYLDRPARGAILVLRCSEPVDRRRRLVRKAEERGVHLATVAPRDGGEWLGRRAAALGLRLDGALFDRLAARLHGATCERMATELQKVAAYAAGANGLDPPVLDLLVPPGREERVFDLLDAAAEGDGARALALGNALRRQGEPLPLLLFLLARHLRTMVRVAAACRGGVRPDAVAARLGLHPFVARKALEQSRRWDEAALAAAWEAVWRAEFGFKSGRLQEAPALDQALLGIVRAARADPRAARGPGRR